MVCHSFMYDCRRHDTYKAKTMDISVLTKISSTRVSAFSHWLFEPQCLKVVRKGFFVCFLLQKRNPELENLSLFQGTICIPFLCFKGRQCFNYFGLWGWLCFAVEGGTISVFQGCKKTYHLLRREKVCLSWKLLSLQTSLKT